MRILVTGAHGFLGASVCRDLFRYGETSPIAGVRQYQSERSWRLQALCPDVEAQIIELSQTADELTQALQDARIEAIVHCAGYGVDYGQSDPDHAIAVNIGGTSRLIQAAARSGVRRVIHVGTAYEFGSHHGPIGETATMRPRGIYGATKAAGATLAIERADSLGLPLAIVRPFGMFGPLEGLHKFVPLIARHCRNRIPLPLTAGQQLRDYTFVNDIAQAIRFLLAADRFPAGEAFNLGTGTAITLRQFGEAVARHLDGLDMLRWGELPYRPDEMMQVVADTSKAERVLGWEARTPLNDALAETLDFDRLRPQQ